MGATVVIALTPARALNDVHALTSARIVLMAPIAATTAVVWIAVVSGVAKLIAISFALPTAPGLAMNAVVESLTVTAYSRVRWKFEYL
jgi:hypothetical protein